MTILLCTLSFVGGALFAFVAQAIFLGLFKFSKEDA